MKKIWILITVSFVAVSITTVITLFVRSGRNSIYVANKTIANALTKATVKSYLKGQSQDVTMTVYGFNAHKVSVIKTLYLRSRLHNRSQSFINSADLKDEPNQFLRDVLMSEVEKKNNLSSAHLLPLSDSDLYFIKMLQKQRILSENDSYIQENQNTELQRVLDGKKFSKRSSIEFLRKFSLEKQLNDFTEINNLLANVLNLKKQDLSQNEVDQLRQIWRHYQESESVKSVFFVA